MQEMSGQPEDKNTLELFRRSIVAAKNIKKGEVFTEELIDVKRRKELDDINTAHIAVLFRYSTKSVAKT